MTDDLYNKNPAPVIVTYDITVENGDGSGKYEEGSEVTLSAQDILDDMFVFKKKLAGWENLPYTTPIVTFETDDDIITKPIYKNDYTILLVIIGAGAGRGGFVFLRTWRKKNTPKKTDEFSDYDELEDDL